VLFLQFDDKLFSPPENRDALYAVITERILNHFSVLFREMILSNRLYATSLLIPSRGPGDATVKKTPHLHYSENQVTSADFHILLGGFIVKDKMYGGGLDSGAHCRG
jgi:hypothetical protein